MADNDKKKKKYSDHPLDTWPPPDREDAQTPQDRRKTPRNTSYVDPIEDLEHTDAPVIDANEPEIQEQQGEEKDEKDEGRNEDNEKS